MIAYADRGLTSFVARPIQMKASSARIFGVDSRYAKFPELLAVYVWDLSDLSRASSYALTYQEALAVATRMGWTSTATWEERGSYTTTRPGAKLRKLLDEHRMTPAKWWTKVVEQGRALADQAP